MLINEFENAKKDEQLKLKEELEKAKEQELIEL